MFDVFNFIDGLNWKINILREDAYLRSVFTYFSISMIGVWFVLGFDSGIGLFERAIPNLPNLLSGSMSFQEWVADAYTLYGRTFHFSAFVTYGMIYIGMSSHLAKLGILRSRNIVYTVFLVALNVSCFEMTWMMLFAKFQMERSILEWLVTDLWFLTQWFCIMGMGLMGLFSVWVESFQFKDKVLVKRNFRFKLRLRDISWIILSVALWIIWIYYPFPVERVYFDDWVSSLLFPQTFYAYKVGLIYVNNDLLHSLNVILKGVFAFTQFHLIRRFVKE